MSLVLSQSPVMPVVSVALPALGPGARAAAVPVVLGPGGTAVDVSADALPPPMQLGALGTVFVDNTQNAQTATITFPDTGAINDIPAGAATYILAVTGGKRFQLSSPVGALTQINLQLINTTVPPTGVQPVYGTVQISAGTLAVSNIGPINGAPASRSQAVPATTSTQLAAANSNRKFLMFQMPVNSDGWVTFNGTSAAPSTGDSLYLQAGEKFLSTGYVPTGAVEIYLTTAGQVPCLEG